MSFNQNPDASLMAAIASAGEGNAYADRFSPALDGALIALNNVEFKDTQDMGRMLSVDFLVVEAADPQLIGKSVGEGFFTSVSDQKGGKANRQRAFSLAKNVVLSLGGDPDDNSPVLDADGKLVFVVAGQPVSGPLTQGIAIVQSTLGEMSRQDQPWRGVVLKANVSLKKSKSSGKEYPAVRYSPVQQTIEQIGATRARIENGSIQPPTGAPRTASAAAPVAATAATRPTTSLLKR